MAIKQLSDRITPSLARANDRLEALVKPAADYFRSVTPRRSGNARRRTRAQGRAIVADYPYAQVLDQGASRQAPQGMTRPTRRWLNRQLRNLFK